MTDEKKDAHVAILERHDRKSKKAVLVPAGQSLEFDVGSATRRWLWPYLGTDWHLEEFIKIDDGSSNT